MKAQSRSGFVVLPEEASSALLEIDQRIRDTGDIDLITYWKALPVSRFRNKVLISEDWVGYIDPVMKKSNDSNYKDVAKLVREFEDSLNSVDADLGAAVEEASALNRNLATLEQRLDQALKKSVRTP